MFKFVATDAESIKRKQPPVRACESCRKKKKRCNHAFVAEGMDEGDDLLTPRSLSAPQQTNGNTRRRTLSDAQEGGQLRTVRQVLQPEPDGSAESGTAPLPIIRYPIAGSAADNVRSESRFIGDLSPEGVFHAATSPDTVQGRPARDSIGVYLAKQGEIPRSSPMSSNLMQRVVMPIFEEQIISALPSDEAGKHLTMLYFSQFHPILPIVDADLFGQLALSDPRRRLLLQGICLIASKSPLAKEHLILSGSPTVLGCKEYGSRVADAMKMTINMGFVEEKLVLIQALSMMSHFTDGPDTADIASQLCGRAIIHAQTLGLHIQGEHANSKQKITMFCALWALDRMNAAFHGRPVIIHERDLRTDLELCIEQQEPEFRLLLYIIIILDKVIGLYRPQRNSNVSPEELQNSLNIPSFEELVNKSGATKRSASTLVSIEALYHAVSILSCRSKDRDQPNRTSTSYLRQTNSASLISMISMEPTSLILFPFVPYAISLALSVAYREMRHNPLPTQRGRARGQFETCCKALEVLGDFFESACSMAAMGRATLKELERVLSSVAQVEQRSRHQSVGIEAVTSSAPPNDPVQPETGIAIPSFDFDASLFDPNMDVFGMFDPNFDLNVIDACLEGNLDLSFPSSTFL